MKCLLVYDIPHDRTRTKIADFCLDYGLDRIQYSAFVGDLTRTYQEELMLKIGERLGKQPGKVQLFTICDKDWRQRLEIIQEAEDAGDEE
ncbi:MAG: CRISPR-associated endonuclease Cas2 [Chloroflexi bacterium]|nr:MAG: CRISPR-associated endonuclease Cas2 [Chloroflexota bacterium]RLC84648.1 MAG: CRISPR-associated endonuclease Cas2 [Chloroflexota bacterium]